MWCLLIVGLLAAARRAGNPVELKAVLRLVPDVLRLLHRLASDASLPRGVRWTLGLVIGYLLMPIDLVPDFIPVVGYADDAVVVLFAIRTVIRRVGPEAVERHWPGTPEGLVTLLSLAGVARCSGIEP